MANDAAPNTEQIIQEEEIKVEEILVKVQEQPVIEKLIEPKKEEGPIEQEPVAKKELDPKKKKEKDIKDRDEMISMVLELV